MQDERTELVKTFEILKVEAAQRNVALSVVDLRWGVTEEEAKSGKVISVCLEEIEHSHPFFIGILGNNYGTVPKREELTKNPELKERYKWLNDAITDDENGMSITEMEIQYGVLKNNKKDIDAAFFFKESGKPDNNERLTHLKNDIRDYCRSKGRNNMPKDYTEVSELCGYVMNEVRNVINKHFPEIKEVTLLDRERSAQKAYINSRHSSYHERQSYYDTIDEFVHDNNQQHLVFTGASGIGKSALLANWILKNEKNPDFNLVYHFIGNSFSGNSYESVLRHICDEIYDLYDIQKDGNWNEKIEEEAQRLVAEVSQKDKQLVIIIDGFNQIVTQGAGKEKLLLWLPSASKNVKYIFSTLPDDETMETFKRREYKFEEVCPLSNEELNEWIPTYTKRVGKSLDDEKEQLQRIVKWSLNDVIQGNMLVLRTLLDELTRFGVYEKVDERIDYYTSSTSIPEFFVRVLSCLEKDYSPEKDLVKHVLILIAVSEHGLSEDELMTILECQQRPLEWKLFFCAFYNHFVEKEGLITFSHQYVNDAVSKRYALNKAEISASYRQEIVAHFASNSSNDEVQLNRNISELAHQYYNLSDWRSLHKTLLSFESFDFFDSNNEFLLAKYWRALLKESNGCYKLSDYLNILEHKNEVNLTKLFNSIGLFVSEYFADYGTALDYNLKTLSIKEENFGAEHIDTARSYLNVGSVYCDLGNYTKALEYYLRAMAIIGKDHPISSVSFNSIGTVYHKLGDISKALDFFYKALIVLEKDFGTQYPTASVYNNIGVVYLEQDDYDKALEYYHKALKIQGNVLGLDNPSIATTYNNIGGAYWRQGDYPHALEYCQKALAIQEKFFDMEHPSTATSYNNIGGVYMEQGNYLLASEYYHKALKIQEKVFGTEHTDTATSYNNIGGVYMEQGNYLLASEYYHKALKIQEKVFGPENLSVAITYSNIGNVYMKQGNFDKSLEYILRAIDIHENILGTKNPSTATLYNNAGAIYDRQGRFDEALGYYAKALEIREKNLGTEHPETAASYSNIGGVYSMQGDYNKASMFFFKALKIQVKVLGTKHPSVATSYTNIGLLYDTCGDYVSALEYYNMALAIEENVLGMEHLATAMTLNNIGGVYWKQGNYFQALEHYNKALEIQEKMLGVDNPDTAQSYNNIGTVYWKLYEYDIALKCFFKALAIQKIVFGNDHPDIATSYNNIGENYCCKKDYKNAMKYYLMALDIQERILGKEHPNTAQTYHNIGSVYLEQGDYVKAFEYLEKAIYIYLNIYGPMHPDTINTLRGLNTIKETLGINI
jgi:preprotein translocase subunit SecA/nephrocystin-3